MFTIPKKLLNFCFDFILPPRCPSCYEPTSENRGFCASCWLNIEFISKPYCNICGKRFPYSNLTDFACGKCIAKPPLYKFSRSLMVFNEHSKKLVHGFKYYDRDSLAKIFASLLCNNYGDEVKAATLIAPVPMNKLKRLFRMYNPAQLLGSEIAKILKINLCSTLLIKSKWTKSQTFLSKAQREKNIAGSIKFNTKYSIKNENILLIDDVFTTGTTIHECCKILKKNGAQNIFVLTITMT